MRSTVVATLAHAILFVIWPAWQVRARSQPNDVIQMIQIDPIETPGGALDLGDGAMALLPTEDEVVPLEEARAGSDVVMDVEGEVFYESAAAGAMYTIVPAVAYTQPAPPLGETGMVLEHLEPITPTMTGGREPVIWPGIRNPTVLTRFLRRSFNGLYRGGATGFVSVAILINERGRVEATAVSESSGYESLDQIALEAFNDVVVFAPARSGGRPIPITVIISVPFTIPW